MATDAQDDVRYALEVYEPGSYRSVWAYFQTTKPFLSISKGDIINPGTWPESKAPQKVLRVVAIEHIIWEIEGDHVTHKLCVFTQEINGDSAAYMGIK